MKTSRIMTWICFLMLGISLAGYAQEKYSKTGMASFYADKFEGRQTANGEIYYHAKKTAAHRSLAFGSIVKVTCLETNKVVVVRINDRGPFVDHRIIDLSKSAAQDLGFVEKGLTRVKIERIASTDELPDKKTSYAQNKRATEYYKVHVNAVQPKGSGIQIGSYRNDENLFKLVDGLKEKYKEEIFIEIASIKKQKMYRVIVGRSNSEEHLQVLKEKLSKNYPGCFIVRFKP